MSGDEVPQGPTRPIDLTDDEVEQLAGGRGSRVAALTRLKAAVPSGPVGTLESRAATPAKVTKAELDAIQEVGRISEKLSQRLTASDLPAARPDSEGGPLPEEPTVVPPSARKAKGRSS